MSAGVGMSSDVPQQFQELKHGNLSFITYTLSRDQKEIVVDKTGTEEDWDNFVTELPELECRWAVYNFAYEQDGENKNKILFIAWSPDSAKIRQKMLFASSRDVLRRALTGVGAEVQATEYDEVAHEVVLSKITRRGGG